MYPLREERLSMTDAKYSTCCAATRAFRLVVPFNVPHILHVATLTTFKNVQTVHSHICFESTKPVRHDTQTSGRSRRTHRPTWPPKVSAAASGSKAAARDDCPLKTTKRTLKISKVWGRFIPAAWFFLLLKASASPE